MFKKNITLSLSVVVFSTMFIIGCGSSSTPSNDLANLPTVSNEAKSLAKSISNQGILGSLARSANPSSKDKKSRELYTDTTDCSVDGDGKADQAEVVLL